MKVQQTPNLQLSNNKNQNKSSNVAFAGGELTGFLNFIQTNQAIGATLVDAGCMCTPRTVVDFTRSPEAGIETARREFSSNINDAALGAYGMGSAYLLSKILINSKFDIQGNKMFVDNDTLDILADIRNRSGDIKSDPKNLEKYFNEVFEKARGFNPNITGSEKTNGWVEIAPTVKKDAIERLMKDFKDDFKAESSPIDKKKLKDAKAYLKALLVRDTGAESEFKLESKILDPKTGKEKVVKVVTSVDDFVDNIYKVSKSFMSDKVIETFGDGKSLVSKVVKKLQDKKLLENNFISSMKKFNAGTAILGVAACAAIGASVQPINMYLTKKKTGKSGFVGGGEENKSAGFTILKTAVAGTAAFLALKSIGKFREILGKIQFKGLVPTIPQFKLVYGITIVSRLLSARNENELRESSIKDSLGFANWLILGGFVSKLAAIGFEKLDKFKKDNVKFIKYNKAESTSDKGILKVMPKWIAGSLVTREEVLHDALKKAGIGVIDKNGKALDFKGMMNEVAKMTDKVTKSAVKSKLRSLALIQVSGYLWSALALGIAIPKLNIAITNSVEKKKHQKSQQKPTELAKAA